MVGGWKIPIISPHIRNATAQIPMDMMLHGIINKRMTLQLKQLTILAHMV